MSMKLTTLFGGAPHARVLDYLADNRTQDHSITEIARGADVARPTVYNVLDDLTDEDIIHQTRTLGNSRLFQLNPENPTVHDLLRLAQPEPLDDPDEGFPSIDLAAPSGPETPNRPTRRSQKR